MITAVTFSRNETAAAAVVEVAINGRWTFALLLLYHSLLCKHHKESRINEGYLFRMHVNKWVCMCATYVIHLFLHFVSLHLSLSCNLGVSSATTTGCANGAFSAIHTSTAWLMTLFWLDSVCVSVVGWREILLKVGVDKILVATNTHANISLSLSMATKTRRRWGRKGKEENKTIHDFFSHPTSEKVGEAKK